MIIADRKPLVRSTDVIISEFFYATWASLRLRSSANGVFVQQFVRYDIKETQKFRISKLLWKESARG